MDEVKRRRLISVSNENEKVASWAADEQHWNVAVSRYYYSIYQKMIIIREKLDPECVLKEDASHASTLNSINQLIHLKRKNDEIGGKIFNQYMRSQVFSLKSYRVLADYNGEVDEAVMKDFKKRYSQAKGAIDFIFKDELVVK